ncbi:MAG: peptidase C39 family protein [Patescibacteria group bacterium]|nr:peptidase C39 family protein [Patescibacteria group bacterium]
MQNLMFRCNVQFYSNTPDDTHCYQAAICMVLKYFLSKKEFDWKKLEKLSAKKNGLWTWPTQSLINFHKMGFSIIDMDNFNIEEFIKNGGNYLIKKYGKEVGEAQIKHSDIENERRIYKKYLKLNLHQQKLPSIKDIKNLLYKGYLIICNVNSKALNNKNGYCGHMVVVCGYDDKNLYLHDPGLPPLKNRKISYRLFNKAWGYPNKDANNLTGFKYPKGYSRM